MSAINLEAFKRAINIATTKNSKPVLAQLPEVLGQLLNAAVSAGDAEGAQELIHAGASVEYQKQNYADVPSDGPYIAFNNYAANITFYMPSAPSAQDIVETFVDTVDNCDKCCDFLETIPAPGNRAEYIEAFFRHEFRKVKSPLLLAVDAKSVSLVDLLLTNGAEKQVDCGYKDYMEHITPFSLAVYTDWLDGIELFIQHGLDINNDIEKEIFNRCTPKALMVFLQHGLLRCKLRGLSDLAVAAGKFDDFVPPKQQESRPCSLKYTCRAVIRRALASSSQQNFFVTATPENLHLPRRLCEYILCGFELIQH